MYASIDWKLSRLVLRILKDITTYHVNHCLDIIFDLFQKYPCGAIESFHSMKLMLYQE